MHQNPIEQIHLRSITALFDGDKSRALRRPVWGPKVENKSEALQFVNRMITQRLMEYSIGFPRVLDLGSGQGDSLAYISKQLPVRGTGIDLSDEQTNQACSLYGEMEHLSFLTGHMEGKSTLEALPCQHHIYSLESFGYVVDWQSYLKRLYQQLKPGGLLLICDDFLSECSFTDTQLETIEELKKKRLVHAVRRFSALVSKAQFSGFDLLEAIDLTPWLRGVSLRERGLIRGLGADPVQKAYNADLLRYKFLVLQKPA